MRWLEDTAVYNQTSFMNRARGACLCDETEYEEEESLGRCEEEMLLPGAYA